MCIIPVNYSSGMVHLVVDTNWDNFNLCCVTPQPESELEVLRAEASRTPRKKRRSNEDTEIQLLTVAKSIMEGARNRKGERELTEDEHWCQALAKSMHNLQPRKKAMLKADIQRLLVDAEFSDEQ